MQKVFTKPIFEHEKDEEFKFQVEKLVESKLAEKAEVDKQKLVEKAEADKQKSVKERLEEIRKGMKPSIPSLSSSSPVEHVHDSVVGSVAGVGDCPTCKGHTLTVKEDTAKCTGSNCGKEFLLVEKVKNIEKDKKRYVCATCGHSVSKSEVEKIKSKDVCPSCGIGKAFFDLAWDKLESAVKNREGYTKI